MEKYGVCTDIEKAFLQVGLDERDRDVTRFLWLSDPSDPNSPLTTYRFKAVLFGATCSPFILSATILKHLENNKENCVSERLREDLYVDNVISSFSRENDLLEYYQHSRSLMLDAGFNLRSWSSNNLELNKRADIDHVLDKDACTKVLGMRWDSSEDRLKTIPICESATKREILQQTSRLYDPLGLLSPVSIRAKLLIQELWKGKFEWDQVLPAGIHKKWLNLLNDINSVTVTTFQRHYFPVNGSDMTGERCIHVFCDSSITSYGAVAYICQDNQSTLMMAKTRVAPIKTITLPRLELMAAMIGARLCKHLQDNTDVSQIYLWSDSQIVLTWLRTQKPLPRFVRNRVSEIKTLTDDRNWRYCPTGDNPADLLTRGISAAQYKTCDLWFHGPTWINKQEDWPVWTEIGKTVTMTTSIGANDDGDDDNVSVRKTCGSIANIGGSDYTCHDGSVPDMNLKIVPGVIGAPSSVTSIQVANLLKLFEIPQVSFFSTSPVLSNRDRYPYFLRTIPSDVTQAQAMVEIVRMFNWTYVSVIYEESSYGIQGLNELEKLLRYHGICIAESLSLMKDSGVSKQEDYLYIVRRLKTTPNARGVIIFASDQEVGELMKAVKKEGATGRFSWIGSDGWGGRGLAYLGKEPEVEGAITVQPLAYEVHGFKDYFLQLNPFNNQRNPWFIEYWEQTFECKFPFRPFTPYNENYNVTCHGSEVIDPDTFIMEAQLQFVSDAMMAFAHALHTMHSDICGEGYPGLCSDMDPVDGQVLKKYLLDVNFTGLSGQRFHFLPNGDGPARYRILNFRQNTSGVYSWDTVGFFQNDQLVLNEDLQFRLEDKLHPESFCSKPCKFDEAVSYQSGRSCCWVCIKCQPFEYLPTKTRCKECPPGRIPSADKTKCIMIRVSYLSYDEPIAMGAMAFSSIGISLTCFVIVVYIRYSDTPIVKASGRELCFVLLAGIIFCYAMTYILVLKPHQISCGAQKFGLGLCFTICYSAILTKTNRIARIFRSGKRTAKRPKFISPKSQLFICGAIVSFQCIIGIMWIIMRPPEAVPFYARRSDHQLVCKDAVGGYYMAGFTYPIILVIVCTIYAVLTRKIPGAFNESKYIGFTMYTTCIIWLAFVPIYFSTASDIRLRIATMSYSISLSATVALVCMFTPKLYVILTHPEKNIRKPMMTTKTLTTATYNPVPKTAGYTYTSPGGTGYIPVNPVPTHQHVHNPVKDLLKGSASNLNQDSYSSGLSSTAPTNGHNISTQTLDSMDDVLVDKDEQM